MPTIKIFATNTSVSGGNAILVVLIMLSSIILLFKVIYRVLVKCLKK